MKKITTAILLSLIFVARVFGQSSGNTPMWLNYGIALDALIGTSVPSSAFLFPDSTVLVNTDSSDSLITINPSIHEIGNIFNAYSNNLQAGYDFQLTSNTPYALDSMGLYITYTRHTANSIVDTLIVYLFQAVPNGRDIPLYYYADVAYHSGYWYTNYDYDTVYVPFLQYNYTANALSDYSSPISAIKIPLTESDTSTINFYAKTFALPTPMNVVAGNLVACAMTFKPGYTYTVGENVDSFANTLSFESLDENPGGYPYYFPDDNSNVSSIINNSVRYNIDPGGYDGLFIPSFAYNSTYTLDDHLIFYHITYNAPFVISPPQPYVCEGYGVALTVESSGSDFTWSPSTGLSATTGSSVIATPTATTTYTVTGLNSYGHTATGYDTVYVAPAPDKPIISIGTSCTLISSATQGDQWYLNNNLIQGGTNQTYDVNMVSGWYFVIVSNSANGCSTPSDSVYIVEPGAAGTITGTSPVCVGQNGVSYSIPAINNASLYSWQLPTGVTFASSDSTTNSITVNFSQSAVSGNVTVSGVGTNCNGPSSSFYVTVNGIPAAAGAIQGPLSVCTGQKSVEFSVPSITNAEGYDWVLPSGATIVNGSNTNTIYVSFSDSAKSGTITVTGTSPNCGDGTTSPSFSLSVHPSPTIDVSYRSATCSTCSDGSAEVLVVGGTPPYSYSWSNNATTDTINNLLPGTYSVCVSDSFECTVCDTFILNSTTGINLIQSSAGISVYPMPNNGQMTVNLNGDGYIAMKIYDELGREIYTKPLNEALQYQNMDVNINYAPNGIYFLQILTQNGIIGKSIVVQK